MHLRSQIALYHLLRSLILKLVERREVREVGLEDRRFHFPKALEMRSKSKREESLYLGSYDSCYQHKRYRSRRRLGIKTPQEDKLKLIKLFSPVD